MVDRNVSYRNVSLSHEIRVKYLWAVLYIQLHYKIFVKDQVFHKKHYATFCKEFSVHDSEM